MTDDDRPDDLDRLFAQARVTPPAGLALRARTRLTAMRRAWRLTALLALDLAALLVLGWLAFRLGAASQTSGALPLARAAMADYHMAFEEPVPLGAALLALVPWSYVLLISLNALFVTGLTSAVLRRAGALGQAGVGGSRR